MQCKNCGNTIEEGATFCSFCRTAVQSVQAPNVDSVVNEQVQVEQPVAQDVQNQETINRNTTTNVPTTNKKMKWYLPVIFIVIPIVLPVLLSLILHLVGLDDLAKSMSTTGTTMSKIVSLIRLLSFPLLIISTIYMIIDYNKKTK